MVTQADLKSLGGKADKMLAEDMARFYADPLGFVMYAYDWKNDRTIQTVKLPEPWCFTYNSEYGPDKWACEFLEDLGEQIRKRGFDGTHPVLPIRMATGSGHGIGKALRPDDEVPTPLGMRKVGSITTGDHLFGEQGQIVRVLGKTHFPDCPFYKVSFSDGTSVEVSSGHLWKVKGRGERRFLRPWRVMSTLEILEAGVKRPNGVAMARQWEVPPGGAVEYLKPAPAVDAYTYGVWLGDGHKACGRITNVDQEVWANVAYPHKGVGNTRTLYGLKQDLVKHGLFGCTTYNAKVDRRYIESRDRLAVLQGLLDTDGWVEDCGGAAFASSSRQLTLDVIEIARSLGLRAREPGFKKNKHAGSWTTHITWDGETTLFRISRKQARLVNPEARYKAKWIESIEPVAQGPGVCFHVEGELFQTKQFIVTHNSTLTAWLVDFIASTRPFCNGVVTANTGEQLSSKTWAEIGKWTKKCITGHWFEVTTGKGSMRLYHKQHPEAWKVSAQTCREENSESFAGLHAANSTPFYIFDEASAVPDQIYEVAEGGLTDGEPMFFLFGNRTRNSGKFNETFKKPDLGWVTRCIDSREVQVTNKALIAEWIRIHGEDSDFVKVRVRGMAPSLSAHQLIGIADLDAAFGRELKEEQYNFAPKILTCDPAWSGGDEIAIGLRQGLRFQLLRAIAKNDNDIEIASILAALEDEHGADAVFIDAGHGTGIYSAGETWGRSWTLVWFGGASARPGCLNKRAEMWMNMRDWLKAGGSIPKDHKLYEELAAQELKPRDDGIIQLVGKAQMDESPNRGDCLALSFAFPVTANRAATVFGNAHQRVDKKRAGDYDPYSKLSQELAGG